MFTGLVQAIGTVTAVRPRGTGRELELRGPWTDLEVGESVACDGVCLTVEWERAGTFQVVAGEETLRRTTWDSVAPGRRTHLERALRLSDRLGGHLVAGHVDGIGVVTRVDRHEGWTRIEVRPPETLLRYIAEKGSVAMDGVSLTVNDATAGTFSVGIIPHTIEVTELGRLAPGARVNLEVDLVARHLERLAAPGLGDTLARAGFLEGRWTSK